MKLRKLQHTDNTGLKALIKETGLEGKALGSYHLGFVLGPCINAAGRLDSAKKAVELLLEDDEEKAAVMAAELTI